jgi:chromosome partitioning protein
LTTVEGLDLLTGSMELANADLVLGDRKGREGRLRQALEPVRADYDAIVFDCPPSLSLVPINALAAADAYIVPVVSHYLALEGLVNLLDTVKRIRAGIGTPAELLGLLLTMVDYRARLTTELVSMIREHYGRQVFGTEIRVNVRLTEAPSFGKPIFDYASTSTGAEAYGRLTDEVIARLNGERKEDGSTSKAVMEGEK